MICKKDYSQLKVAVLMGGIGEEREISTHSGQWVGSALEQAGIDVVCCDIGPDNLKILEDTSIDVFFLALHGKFGEDGRLQQILQARSLCYTGSGPEASELAFDKLASKDYFTRAGAVIPKAIKFTADKEQDEIKNELLEFGEKLIVKPVRQGSTIGVSIENDISSAIAAAGKCLNKFGDCMIEEFIAGREITVGILGNQPLPIVEIKTKSGFYDYNAKYLDDETQYLFDTIEPSAEADIQQQAMKCFNALGLRHFARIDFILADDGKAYVLEANTLPGMTGHSLVPKAAEKAGLSMSDLCIKIIEAALRDKKMKVAG